MTSSQGPARTEQGTKYVWLRRLRRAVQYLVLILFIYLLFGTRSDGAPLIPMDTFFRLDPLAGLTAMLAGRRVIAGMLWGIAIIVLTVALGRVWCGWLCPMGTVLDMATFRVANGDRAKVSARRRTVKYVLLAAILFAAVLGNQTLMILDPIGLLTRTMATVILPTLDVIVTALEGALFPLAFLQGPLSCLDGQLRGSVLPATPHLFASSLFIALVFAGILALNRVASRFWCRYLCPLGALLGVFARFAPLRRLVSPACTRCGRCARACPTGTVDAGASFASDPAECTLCLDCAALCPADAIGFPASRPQLAGQPAYDPSRRQLLGTLALSALGIALLRVSPAGPRHKAGLIRPPGGRENMLVQKCVRCGLCLKVCPTGGLQPAWSQDGPEAPWTPALVSRLGYCDYSCNACGRVCPSKAIPELDLETKRTVIIGQAHINRDRCLPWSDNRSCTVCEEMCPVPDKAIKLEHVSVVDATGAEGTIGRPYVERERCIGCGICEYQCPVAGEAAIRVYVRTDLSAGASA